MYRVEDIITECADATFGEGGGANVRDGEFSRKTYDNVWNGLVHILRSNGKNHRGVVLPHFARITYQKVLKKPKFIMSQQFLKTYGVKFNERQASRSPETATKDLNFAKLSQLAKCTKDVTKTVYRELTQRIGEVLKDGGNQVGITFKGIGVLRGDKFRLQFFFEGEKGSRLRSSASFTKRAPDSAKGMMLAGSNRLVGNQQEQQVQRNAPPSSRRGGDNSGRSLPKIPSARSIKGGMNNDLGQSFKNSTMGKSRSVPTLQKGLSISETIGTAPRNKNLLNDKDLEQMNLDLMADRKRVADQRRRLDEKEFRDEILMLHKDVIADEDKRKAAVEKEARFKEEQLAQGEIALDRKREVRAAYLAAEQQHWPFSLEEQVRHERRKKDGKFRKELDQQNATLPKKKRTPRPRPEDTVNPKDPDTWFQPSEGNIYPKFLTPSRSPTRMVGDNGKDPLVLRLAYKRYEKVLRNQLSQLKAQTKDIKEREVQKEAEISHRARRRKEIQKQTTEYQFKQVEYNRKQKEKELRETHLQTNPDPSRAYPMEQLRDAHRLNRAKASLRHALDSQVATRDEIKKMRSTIEQAEDNYFLGCVQEQLELDRAHRIKKKHDEQQAMMSTWKRQETFKNELRKLEKMRDGVVVREGTKVVSQDEIELPGGNGDDG